MYLNGKIRVSLGRGRFLLKHMVSCTLGLQITLLVPSPHDLSPRIVVANAALKHSGIGSFQVNKGF